MNKPYVSIIVPVYNVAEYLPLCIDSIISQTEDKWELILIDDGSKDSSASICDNYAKIDKRIHVIHKINEGVSSARNIGIELAKGETICFIDSDDWVEPNYLSSLLNRYNNQPDTVVYGNIIHENRSNKTNSIAFNYKENRDINNCIIENKILENGYPVAKLFNADLIRKNKLKFNTNISFHEDHIFVLQYLKYINNIKFSNVPTYHYIHRATKSSLSKIKHKPEDIILASRELNILLKELIEKYKLTDINYIKKIYTLLVLNQLIRQGILSSNIEEIETVSNEVKKYSALYKRYYSPNHKIMKIMPKLFMLKFNLISLCICKILVKFI